MKPGAVVLDVGINVREPVGGNGKAHKHKLVGDVNFAQVSQVASAISPVPGGAPPARRPLRFAMPQR